ncbi:MAG: ABC transporter permease subunit [Candidatus Riflebacteria bacterium]|nr:ABC transporter permease subunit [Candidatus Riflebacteria bacterium]
MMVREQFRSGLGRLVLPALPFLVVILIYARGSHERHLENPKDKLMPTGSQLVGGLDYVVQVRDENGYTWEGWKEFRFWQVHRYGEFPSGFRIYLLDDAIASLKRLFLGLGLSSILALVVGLHMGAFPAVETLMLRFISFFSFVPPLALLPLVFIYLGTGETAKVAIVFLGTFFDLTQNFYLRILEVPERYVFQAYAQGASTPEVLYKICLVLKLPPILDTIRLAMRPAWVYLIAAELIAAEAGLGYRISLVQRTLRVDVILWYILFIALLGYMFDAAVRLFVRKVFPWSQHV